MVCLFFFFFPFFQSLTCSPPHSSHLECCHGCPAPNTTLFVTNPHCFHHAPLCSTTMGLCDPGTLFQLKNKVPDSLKCCCCCPVPQKCCPVMAATPCKCSSLVLCCLLTRLNYPIALMMSRVCVVFTCICSYLAHLIFLQCHEIELFFNNTHVSAP